MQQQQKREQENLMKLAQELKNRELDLLGRELKIIMNNAPTPLKRRGKIGTSKLKVRWRYLRVITNDDILYSFSFWRKLQGRFHFHWTLNIK